VFVLFLSESFRAIAFTPDTNISMNESSAEPRIASEPEKNPIIALRIARNREIMRANLIANDGVEGSFIM
jgi:hypothetical protein